jgi:chromosome segregation ATPase
MHEEVIDLKEFCCCLASSRYLCHVGLLLQVIRTCWHVLRYGVACITLDGRKHSKGSLEGGYRDKQGLSACADKLAADDAALDAHRAVSTFHNAQLHVHKVSEALQAAESHSNLLNCLQAALEELEHDSANLWRSMHTIEAARAEAEQCCADIESMLAARPNGKLVPNTHSEKLQGTEERLAQHLSALQARAVGLEQARQVQMHPSLTRGRA